MRKHSTKLSGDDTPDTSRRNFLKTAAAGGALLSTASTVAMNNIDPVKQQGGKTTNPFEQILSRCGSEFGDIRKPS